MAPVIERHDVSVLGTVISCSCTNYAVDAHLWGPSTALALATAHRAAPHRSAAEVLAFVVLDREVAA